MRKYTFCRIRRRQVDFERLASYTVYRQFCLKRLDPFEIRLPICKTNRLYLRLRASGKWLCRYHAGWLAPVTRAIWRESCDITAPPVQLSICLFIVPLPKEQRPEKRGIFLQKRQEDLDFQDDMMKKYGVVEMQT